jgi:hypothetical protein
VIQQGIDGIGRSKLRIAEQRIALRKRIRRLKTAGAAKAAVIVVVRRIAAQTAKGAVWKTAAKVKIAVKMIGISALWKRWVVRIVRRSVIPFRFKSISLLYHTSS